MVEFIGLTESHLTKRFEKKYERTTTYKNNSRNSSKYEHCSPQQY